MSKRKVGIMLIVIGSVLILAAFSLVGYNIWDDHRAQTAIDSVLDQISLKDPDDVAVPDYLLDPTHEMPSMEIDGYLYIGKLSVPSLDLELPVMETWDYERMKIAPCRYAGTAYLNNLVICAHNYASHFGRLKNLLPGDAVTFTDMDGNVFFYEVAEVQTLASTSVEEMKSGGWDLTLFTCTFDGQARVTVRCSKVKTTNERK